MTPDPDYFAQLEPDFYRFEILDGIPTLRCYNRNGERTSVYIIVEYSKCPEWYIEIPLEPDSREALSEWFDEQDNKPF